VTSAFSLGPRAGTFSVQNRAVKSEKLFIMKAKFEMSLLLSFKVIAVYAPNFMGCTLN
jgi:hypothetical protein